MKKTFLHTAAKTVSVAVLLACALGILVPSTVLAAGDTVRVGRHPYLGEIVKMTPNTITLKSSSGNNDIPTNKITVIRFGDEPREMTQAREAVTSGRFEDAPKALAELKTDGLKDYIVADAAFYGAAAAAELALRGRTPLNDAGSKLQQFIKTYPNNFHYYEANRLIGDLLMANGQPDAAVPYYQNIAKAPWPEYQLDAKIAIATALLEADQTAEAQKLLAEVNASSDLDAAQKVKVELLAVQKLINQNKPAEAITQIDKLIKLTPADAIDVNAQAYNMLGRAHRRAGQPQDALLAFLHVDMLYSGNATAHAEALGNLVELWTAEHKPDRAELAKETLKQRYQHSRWNKF